MQLDGGSIHLVEQLACFCQKLFSLQIPIVSQSDDSPAVQNSGDRQWLLVSLVDRLSSLPVELCGRSGTAEVAGAGQHRVHRSGQQWLRLVLLPLDNLQGFSGLFVGEWELSCFPINGGQAFQKWDGSR